MAFALGAGRAGGRRRRAWRQRGRRGVGRAGLQEVAGGTGGALGGACLAASCSTVPRLSGGCVGYIRASGLGAGSGAGDRYGSAALQGLRVPVKEREMASAWVDPCG